MALQEEQIPSLAGIPELRARCAARGRGRKAVAQNRVRDDHLEDQGETRARRGIVKARKNC